MTNRLFLLIATLTFSLHGVAEDLAKINFAFKDAEIQVVIDAISKLTQKTFEVDASVRGKINIVAPQNVTIEEAYNLFSSGLATNGLAIVESGAHYRIMPARNAVRSGLPVVTEMPQPQPERMVTYVYKLKHISGSELIKAMGRVASPSGSIDIMDSAGTVFVSDFTSNLVHIKKIFDLVDIPSVAAPMKKNRN